MASKWQIDPAFLQETITQGYRLLDNPSVSSKRKRTIKNDIIDFNRYLQGDFDIGENDASNVPKDLEKLKTHILNKMQKQYKKLGPELINWIIDLSYEAIFETYNKEHDYQTADITNLTIDEQAELTMENYKKHSPRFYIPAKEIIVNNKIRQIQLVTDKEDCDSYHRRNTINHIPLIIINSKDAPNTLNHETQHGNEEILKYKTPFYYSELGSSYFELLFTDELYKRQGYILEGDCQDKIAETDDLLYLLGEYFRTLLAFANKNFEIPTDEFLSTFIENENISADTIEDYLREEIATSEIDEDMDYVFSYLKAIELREKTQDFKGDSALLLDRYNNTRKFRFDIPQNGYAVYERFVQEVKEKTKTM